MEGDAVEGLVVSVSREEAQQTLNEIKTGKAPGPSEDSLELIAASGGVGIEVMAEIYFLRTSGRCNRQSEFTLLHFTIFH